MRTGIGAFAVLCALSARSQGVVEVFYCVPPDMGCEGYCALDLPDWNACVEGGGPMNFTPNFCADFDPYYTDGDTLFIGICNDPCEITIVDDMGGVCICSLASAISTAIPEHTPQVTAMRNGDVLRITSTNVLHQPTMDVFDSAGRRILAQPLRDGDRWEVPLEVGSNGLYFLRIRTDDGSFTARF